MIIFDNAKYLQRTLYSGSSGSSLPPSSLVLIAVNGKNMFSQSIVPVLQGTRSTGSIIS